MATPLLFGIHDYDAIVKDWHRGVYDFASVVMHSGDINPLVGFSERDYKTMSEIVADFDLHAVIYGSRVAGPRSHQRTLHPILRDGVSMSALSRHGTSNFPTIFVENLDKTKIKQLGRENPHTSDMSVAITGSSHDDDLEARRECVSACEIALNERLGQDFPVRVYHTLHNVSFHSVQDFLDFGREFYMKRELPADHPYRDDEVDAAFSKAFAVLE